MKLAKIALVAVLTCFTTAAYTNPESANSTKRPAKDNRSASQSGDRNGSDILRPEFEALDRDRDGVLTKAEIASYARARDGDFEQADKDHDGRLSMEEFRILHANTSVDRRLGSQ